jgi:hypothetical protein
MDVGLTFLIFAVVFMLMSLVAGKVPGSFFIAIDKDNFDTVILTTCHFVNLSF